MKKRIDMLNGDIKKVLFALALPIIASNFIQTAYGMIDMIWIGKVGADAVSAIGTANFYINLAAGVASIMVIGSGIRIAQMLGADKPEDAADYTKNALVFTTILALIVATVLFVFSDGLLEYFNMNNPAVETMALQYLRHALVGVPFMFLSTLITSILTSYGNTKLTFKANAIGLVLNIFLDPLMIFGYAGFPAMGVIGAAWATTISRIISVAILIIFSNHEIIASFKAKIDLKKLKDVVVISAPATAQTLIFTAISMVIGKLVIEYGTDAIATQKIGIQIESITWVTIGGLQGAISAFVGQNFGAKKYDRISDGFNYALKVVTLFGLAITLTFVLIPKPIFSIFISDHGVIDMGVGYMSAIGFSQVFMCFEMLSVGAFNGMGKTYVPPLVSILFTLMRIPLAMFLMQYMGLSGIWWSISISSMVKGITLLTWYQILIRKTKASLVEAI